MKNIISLLFSLNCLVFSQDKLLFNQGEQWDGKVSSVTDKIIKVKSSLSKEDLQFKLDNLKAIEFSDTKALKGTHRITLINGDGLTGDLEELNKEFLILKTLCSGILPIPRKYVSAIKPIGSSELILGGISNKDGWKSSIDSDGSFKGTIYRDIDSTKPFIITAEIDLSSVYSFYISLNNKPLRNDQRFYFHTTIRAPSRRTLIMNGQHQAINTGILRASSGAAYAAERITMGNKSIEENSQLVKLEIFTNPQEGFVAANVNNIEVGKVKFKSKFDFDKMILSLRSNGGKPYLKNFKIEKWDGKYTSYIIADKVDKHDNILLKNGDMAHGKIVSIKNKKLAFSSKLGDHKLAMDLVSTVFLNNSKSESIKENHIVRLQTGQKITGNLLKIENDIVYIKNDLFPNLKIKKDYCRVLINKNFADKKSKVLQTITKFGDNKVFGAIELLKDKKLKFSNANLVKALTFDVDSISEIKFPTRSKIEESDWLIDMVNGDFIPCKIKSMDTKEIIISANSSELRIKTTDVQRIFKRIIRPRKNSRNGPVILSYSSSQLDIKLPTKSEINFTVETVSNPSGRSNFNNIFQIRLFGDKKGTRKSYYLQLSSFPKLYFRENIQAEEHRKIKFNKINDVTIKIDKTKALFELWLNGEHTHSFTDPSGFQAEGDIITMYNNSRYKVSKLRFNEWNGDQLKAEKFVIGKDFKVHKGEVTAIGNDTVTMGDKSLKIADVREIILCNPKIAKDKAKYTVHLLNLASLTADEISIEGEKVVIKHPLMGELYLEKSKILEIKGN